jgi:hypothetical protein
VILVRNKFFSAVRPDVVRVAGIGVAVAMGLAFACPVLTESDAPFTDRAVALATTPIAVVLAWLFAHRAVRPGWRWWLSAALAFDIAAVFAGSFVVAAGAGVAAGEDLGVVIGGGVALGLLGLVFLGIPMLAFGFVVALVWVGLVRLVVRFISSDPFRQSGLR